MPLLPGTRAACLRGRGRSSRRGAIGYPVMLKSTAGGGGIGMRLCATSAELLPESYDAVERLSRASFGTGGLYLEKFVANARHIEVQIFGDGAGQRGGAGRARLLGAAPQSEGDRGNSGARPDARGARRAVRMPPSAWAKR